ncbi:hypothetical protein D9758_014898 [Tetrapyrgos nigripes]|uniref:F-box domain-containing protein n=1 Tax=Tetrapyrgos nigripes TaxID=182062 RepID=A0A8H5FK34_9AGAR|nr:hypothetical protein D9758_014898 [Tetrapyrgos nigripes]
MTNPVPFPVEIFEEVFSYVVEVRDADLLPKPHSIPFMLKASLLSCALSCRTLCRLALNAIWHTLDSFKPLLKLLPFDVVDGTFMIAGEIPDAAWKRFDHYVRMVKRFLLCEATRSHPLVFRNAVYIRLALHRPRPFPSLTTFICTTEKFSYFMMLFISPHIREFVYWFGTEDNAKDIAMYLSCLKSEAPLLRRITIGCLGTCYLPVVLQFHNLRHLSLCRSDPDNGDISEPKRLDSLSCGHLEYLTELELDIHGLSMDVPAMRGRSDSPPRRLERLSLTVDPYSLSTAQGILELYQDSPVQSLELLGSTSMDMHTSRELFDAIPSSWLASLATFTVDC